MSRWLPASCGRFVSPPVEEPAERKHILKDIGEGVGWLWRHRAVRTLALTMVSFNITFGAAWSVLVLYAIERLHLGEVGFGLLTTASALGGLVSTGCFGWLERHVRLATLMRVCLSLEVLVHLALAVTTVGWVGAAHHVAPCRRRCGNAPCRRSSRAGSAVST